MMVDSCPSAIKFAVFKINQLPRFHVRFWLSHILVYLFYLRPSLCPS